MIFELNCLYALITSRCYKQSQKFWHNSMKHNLLGVFIKKVKDNSSHSPISMLWVSNSYTAWSQCNLQIHQRWSKEGGGGNLCTKYLSQYILWLFVLIFQVLKSNIWRKNETHRIKLYFLEMNCHALL